MVVAAEVKASQRKPQSTIQTSGQVAGSRHHSEPLVDRSNYSNDFTRQRDFRAAIAASNEEQASVTQSMSSNMVWLPAASTISTLAFNDIAQAAKSAGRLHPQSQGSVTRAGLALLGLAGIRTGHRALTLREAACGLAPFRFSLTRHMALSQPTTPKPASGERHDFERAQCFQFRPWRDGRRD